MAYYGGYDAMPFAFGPGAHAGPTSAYSFVGAGAAANVPYSSHKLTRATPRREMEMRKRLGTGHQTTRREVSIIGRRTGVVIPDTIRRDARGFEDPTHFFDEVREEDELRHASPNVYKQSNARQSLGGARQSLGGGVAKPQATRAASPPRRSSMVPTKTIRAISPIPARPSPVVRGKKKYVESPPSYADEQLDDPSPVPRRGRQHGRHQDSSTDVSRGRSPPPRKSHKDRDRYADKRSSKASYKSRRHQEYSDDTSRDPTPARKRKITPPRKPQMKTSTAMQTLPTPKGMATQTSRNASTVSAAGRRSTPSASPAPRKKPSPAPVAAVTKRRTPTPPADDLNESGFGNDYEYEHHATPSPPKRRTPVKQQAAGSKPRGRPVGGGVSKAKPTAVKPANKKEKPVKVSKPRQPREKAVYVAPRSGLAEAVLNESTTGARRSSRRMFRPLQYWRNERVVYEREKGGGKLLPEVVDVLIRSPDTVVAPRRRK